MSWVGLWVVGWVGSCRVGESGWKSGDSKFGSFGQALGAGGLLCCGGVKAACKRMLSTGVAGSVCLWIGGGTYPMSAWFDVVSSVEAGATVNSWQQAGAAVNIWQQAGATVNNWQQAGATVNNWQQAGATVNNWQQAGATVNNWQQPGATVNNWQQAGATVNNWQQAGATVNNWQQAGATVNNWQQAGAGAGMQVDRCLCVMLQVMGSDEQTTLVIDPASLGVVEQLVQPKAEPMEVVEIGGSQLLDQVTSTAIISQEEMGILGNAATGSVAISDGLAAASVAGDSGMGLQLSAEQLMNLTTGDYLQINGEMYKVEVSTESNPDGSQGQQIISFEPAEVLPEQLEQPEVSLETTELS